MAAMSRIYNEFGQMENVLSVESVSYAYGSKRHAHEVIRCVTFTIHPREHVALMGPSGSGKTTLARICAGLLYPTAGEVSVCGISSKNAYKHPQEWFSQVQYLAQDPRAALNTRWTIEQNICEAYARLHVTPNLSETARSSKPLHWYRPGYAREICARYHDVAVSVMDMVGLSAEYLKRYPHELSGGQLQRASLARVIAIEPKLLILDEPTSALDSVSTGQIADLLAAIERDTSIATLQIHHERALAQRLCTRFLQCKPSA